MQRFTGLLASALLPGAKRSEVLASFRGNIRKQFEHDSSSWQSAQGDVEETTDFVVPRSGGGLYIDGHPVAVFDFLLLAGRNRSGEQ